MPEVWKLHRPGAVPVLAPAQEREPCGQEIAVEIAGCLLEPHDATLAAGADASAVFPLTPGRHSSGRVVAAGPEAVSWIGRPVLVPELLPCGSCDACRRALPLGCQEVVRPGVLHPGGLGERLVVPARFVVPLDGSLAWARPLGEAAAIGRFALAYQALACAGLGAGDVAVARDDEALSALLRAKGARAPGPDAPRVGWRLFARHDSALDPDTVVLGSTIVFYGPGTLRDLAPDRLAQAEATLRFVRGCHPDLYPELVALAMRAEIDVDIFRLPLSRGDEALARCAAGPVLVVRE